jgi:hypothetical protein
VRFSVIEGEQPAEQRPHMQQCARCKCRRHWHTDYVDMGNDQRKCMGYPGCTCPGFVEPEETK